jgi:hypothetical protein
VQQVAALPERLFHNRLAIQVEQVKGEHAHFDLDILHLDVLLLARHKLLEGQDLFLLNVPRHGLAVQHEALGVLLDPGGQLGEDVWVLLG